MAKYYIGFSGYCSIEADSKEEAEEKFWDGLQALPEEFFDDAYEIEEIEEW